MPEPWPKPPSFTAEVPLGPASLDCVAGLMLEPGVRRGPAVWGDRRGLVAPRVEGDSEEMERELFIIL